ncbi:MAG: succinate dehydrogenase, cytochrome b556 subunit [Burkholderiaceae bacterium]
MSSGAAPAVRPRFLRLIDIRFPVGAIASIGHRLSGLLMAAALPLLPLLLDRSLRSRQQYEALADGWRSAWFAPLEFLLIWAVLHHVLAGIRHLLMDIGIGTDLRHARASARAVLALAFIAAAALAAWRRWP